MTDRVKCSLFSLFALLFLTPLILTTSGCQKSKDIRQVFADRPSEHMPTYKPVQVQVDGQNWSAQQRDWMYHSSQGTELLPYEWFLALEQPKVKFFGKVPAFRDTAYLASFGFLPDAAGPENPDALPVGFAKDTVVDPHTGEKVEVVGFTCAACHTGQIEYKGKGVRIDGGSASADLLSFQTELGYALAFTDGIPFRFDRFAKKVLGENVSSDAKAQLKRDFEKFLNTGLAEKNANDAGSIYPAASNGGFGRTDALGRIGNYVFGTELDNANLRAADAPVSIPPIWYTSWFAWVQYNASIQQPMVRNIGEALGVRARVNLTDPKRLFASSVNVKNLWAMENLLAGPKAFTGLHSPVWPADVLGPIDAVKSAAGKDLYAQHCQRCHLPPLDSAEIQQPQYWEMGLEGHGFLSLKQLPLDVIGTDPRAATNWHARTANTGALGLGTVSAATGLQVVTRKIADMNYDAMQLSAEQRLEWNGFRDEKVVDGLAYKARPLGGMWATPPFLHNGSVPNLYELLLPATKRSPTFYTGSREFDPRLVGYATEKFDNGFLFDTSAPGNSNAGHEFRNAPPGTKGVIGPELSDEERWALIEYLKML